MKSNLNIFLGLLLVGFLGIMPGTPLEAQDMVCTADYKLCPDGTYVDRDADNSCEFFPVLRTAPKAVLMAPCAKPSAKHWIAIIVIGMHPAKRVLRFVTSSRGLPVTLPLAESVI